MGAVIGKALGSLDSGTGMIEALVMLCSSETASL